MGVYIAAADPASEDPELKIALQRAGFVIVQDLFLTETAKLADVVLPAQAVMEREGTVVSGERRLQYYAPAVPAPGGTRADHAITLAIAEAAGIQLDGGDAAELFGQLATEVDVFKGITLADVKKVREQTPSLGRSGMYYGGTSYENKDGLGLILPLKVGTFKTVADVVEPAALAIGGGSLLAVPVTRLYDRGGTVTTSGMITGRIARNLFSLHPADAQRAHVKPGEVILLKLDGREIEGVVDVDAGQPEGVVLVTRSMGASLSAPLAVTLSVLQRAPVNS